MATIKTNGAELYYQRDGSGDPLLAAGIPGASLQLVDGAGHQSSRDHPEEVTRAIEFLVSVRATSLVAG